MDQFLAQQTKDGTLDSLGTFTLSPEEARQKMQASGLSDPSHYVLKIVQAAVAAGCSKLEVMVDRYRLRFLFAESDQLQVALEGIASALLSVATLPPGWLRHLAIGINAAAATGIAEVVWRTPAGSVALTDSELKIEKGHGPYELTLLRESGLWQSLFGTGFAGEYAVLHQRCQFVPLDLNIDGRQVERPFCDRYPSDASSDRTRSMWEEVRPGSGLWIARPPSDLYEPRGDLLIPRTDAKNDGGGFPLVFRGPTACGKVLPGGAFVAIFPFPEKRGRAILVKDGVTLDPVSLGMDSPAVDVVAEASELAVDMTEFKVVEDNDFHTKLRELRGWIRQVLTGLDLDAMNLGLTRLHKIDPQTGYDVRFTVEWLRDGDLSGSRYPMAATLGLLGIPPLDGEQILLSFPAVKRFGLSAHLNCRAVATDQRLVFWNSDKKEHSWELSWNQVARRRIEDYYESDLYLSQDGLPTLEMGLKSVEDREKMRSIIEQQTSKEKG